MLVLIESFSRGKIASERHNLFKGQSVLFFMNRPNLNNSLETELIELGYTPVEGMNAKSGLGTSVDEWLNKDDVEDVAVLPRREAKRNRSIQRGRYQIYVLKKT